MANAALAAAEPPPLKGPMLVMAGILLAMGNFVVILDMTIANVSVPNIAGGLAVSASQGTWVISSYAVAEAIMVPLTGWLAQRFGAVKVAFAGMLGFGLCSALCGMAPSLGLLVTFRVMQGLCGGPIMPMSQTLMMRVFPVKQRGQAIALWSMTTVVAPIAGPLLGGFICDSVGWPWIFYINLPVAGLCSFFILRTLRNYETPTRKAPVDVVGLLLLIVFVGALEIMLDRGRELDWFGSPVIVCLALVSAVGFIAFLIWELTDPHPIVNLKVLRHRSFVAASLAVSLGFGAYFASVVLMPLWLQTSMGYTASWAGRVTAFGGVMAIVMSPIVPRLMGKIDYRILVTFGVFWLGLITFTRSSLNTNADYWSSALPYLFQGIGMPFFFIPTTQLALMAVRPDETASAAGLFNFLRTMSSAVATALITTGWDDATQRAHANLAGALNDTSQTQHTLMGGGLTADQAINQIDGMAQGQSVMLATDQMFLVATIFFVIAMFAIWIAPRPKPPAAGGAGMSGGH